MLSLQLSKKAQKFLSNLPKEQQNQLALKIRDLKQNGHAPDSVYLKGSSGHRLDFGEYRIVYNIEEPD